MGTVSNLGNKFSTINVNNEVYKIINLKLTETAQSVKCSLHYHQNLDALRKQIQKDPGDLLARISSKLVNSSFSERPCIQKVKRI